MAEAPNRYDDPYWTQIAAQAEARNGLPTGVVQAIVTHGERSNNDQVSSAGARTPFQIIPPTRDLFLKKYGIDAYLGPEQAATIAALHIKESLDRGASVPRAIAEYNGGPDPTKWDKTVPSYVQRVLTGLSGIRGSESSGNDAGTPKSTFQTVLQERKPQATSQLAQIYDAYKSGKMAPEDAQQFEADINAGRIMLPRGGTLVGQQANAPTELPAGILKAYKEGRMLREDMIDLERDVTGGMWTLPKGEALGKTDKRGMVGNVVEAFTGAERATPTTKGLQDYVNMPEFNTQDWKQVVTRLGTMTSGPAEIAKIIKEQNPDVKVRQDEKGNYVMLSPTDGNEYSIKPGATAWDALRGLATVAAFGPATRATTVAGSALANAATQAAIEGVKGAAGGDASLGNIAGAGAIGAAVPAIAKVVQAMRNPAGAAIEQAAPIVGEVANPAAAFLRSNRALVDQVPMRRIGDRIGEYTTLPPTNEVAMIAQTDPRITLSQGDIEASSSLGFRANRAYRGDRLPRNRESLPPNTTPTEAVITGETDNRIWPSTGNEMIGRTINLGEQGAAKATPGRRIGESEYVPPAAPSATVENVPRETPVTTSAPQKPFTTQELRDLFTTASGNGMQAVKAQETIVAAARVDKEALQMAKQLGFDLPADVFSTNPQIRFAAGLARSVPSSQAEAGFSTAISGAAKKADELMGTLDASRNVGAVSQDVLSSLSKTRSELLSSAEKIYGEVDAAVPKETRAIFPNLKRVLAEVKNENPNTVSGQERLLDALSNNETATYGDLSRQKSLIGQALANKASPYLGSMETGALKRLYGALAEDQLAIVEKVSGTALRDKLREGNQLYAKHAGLSKRIVYAFGKEGEGSIANIMSQAITAGSKGNIAPLNALVKTLKLVPEDLRKETIATALMSQARSGAGVTKGDFGFAEFAKIYRGLKDNPPVYDKIIGELGGKPAHDLLSSLYTVSKYVTDARSSVIGTGKALFGEEQVAGFLTRVLQRIPGNLAAVTAYHSGANLAGGSMARSIANAIVSNKPSAQEAAARLFQSPEFQKMLEGVSTGVAPVAQDVHKLAISKRFANFANTVGLPREMSARERWIMQAMEAGNAQGDK